MHRGVAEAPRLGDVVVDERGQLAVALEVGLDEVARLVAGSGLVEDVDDAVEALADERARACVGVVARLPRWTC